MVACGMPSVKGLTDVGRTVPVDSRVPGSRVPSPESRVPRRTKAISILWTDRRDFLTSDELSAVRSVLILDDDVKNFIDPRIDTYLGAD